MDCPTCGYVMSDFDRECPRCARLKAMGRDPAALASPSAASAPTVTTQVTQAARETARSVKIEPLFKSSGGPELGWPLTILLWFVIIINGAFVILLMGAAVYVQLAANSEETTRAAGTVMLLLGGIPAIRMITAIGALRSQRLGLFVFFFFALAPGIVYWLLTHTIWWLDFIFGLGPGIAIFALTLNRFDEFD